MCVFCHMLGVSLDFMAAGPHKGSPSLPHVPHLSQGSSSGGQTQMTPES